MLLTTYAFAGALRNFITDKAAYSLHPRVTFELERNIVLRGDLNDEADEKRFLTALGWTTAERINEASGSLGQGKRYFGDALSWKINFEDGHGFLQRSVNEEDVEESKMTRNSFNLVVSTGKRFPEIQFKVLKPVFFKDTYTAAPEVAYKAKFWFALIRALEAQIGCSEACV